MDPQSFALAAAQQELAHLEEKKKEAEERQAKHDVEHLTHKLRSGGRDHKDNQSCARTLCMWGVFNGMMYGLALMGDSWSYSAWHATGVEQFSLTLGLFNMDIDLKCRNSFTGQDQFCHMLTKWYKHENGHWSTKEMQEAMCNDPGASKNTCDVGWRLYYAGWFPLVLYPAAAVFECLSLLLLYFYWHVRPTSMIRILADKCSIMSCICGAMGMTLWFAVRPWLTGFPRYWAEMTDQKNAAASVFNGFKEIWTLPTGWAFICGIIAIFGTFARVMGQYGLPFHIDEPDPYGLDEGVNFGAEAKAEAERMTYGTAI